MKEGKTKSGQSMFEILFAFAIMALVVVAIVGMATVSIRNSSYSRNKTLAEKYAQEANEWLREQRDTSWPDFADNVNALPYCMNNLGFSTLGVCSDNVIAGTPLSREVTLTAQGVNVEAKIVVYWTDSKGIHETNLITTYSNWKPSN